MSKTSQLLPQVAFSILLALSLKPRHGYELMQQIEQDSRGIVKIGPGALYGTIKQLRDEALIEEVPSKESRRRYYALTKKGRERLGAELNYYDNSLKLAEKRHLIKGNIEATAWMI